MAFFEMILNFGATTRYAGLLGRSFCMDAVLLPIAMTAAKYGIWGFRTLHQLRTSAYVPIESGGRRGLLRWVRALFRLEAMRVAWNYKKLFR